MRTGSRVFAVLLAATVWVYAAMSLASKPLVSVVDAPSVLEVAATATAATAATD